MSGSEKENDLPAAESPDMSSIEKASFLQGEEYSSHGNPLHSTALEDESRPETDHQPEATAGKRTSEGRENEFRGVTETPKRPVCPAKNLKARQESDVQAQKKSSKSRGNRKPTEQIDCALKSRRVQNISERRKNEGKKRAQSEGTSSGGSATDTSPDAVHAQSQRRPSLSSEDLTDEDESFHLSRPTASRMSLPRPKSSSSQPQRGQKQKRKSSSGSTDRGNPSKKQKPGGVRNPIALDVVLEAFQEFVTQYKEPVSSEVVKKAINAFSHSFEEQLTEKITAAKDFNNVKREAVKVNKTLNQKTTRLLEAKNELIKSTAEARKLEKERSDLEQRLTALKQGTAFLNNLYALNTRYLQHRSTHTDEPETYGPSCMPAMLLEARSITGTENQLKNINDQLQRVLEETAHEEHCNQ
ncbi:centromere protein U isoform X2 [Ictalurus punctatus]|uniref:Centromere protein U n=1 Tax=Ictalurus punctatus TaxID=7998 RepID=A0A9F7TID7_ICTPU|nr:centromere protein U isoform X2 [Ictalurus punctatus]XP_053538334.1 centromere protein U isoform X2 [Ictalurus punctatus]